eukprot:PhF_6_TR42688/c0_g1_i1/m.64405
MSGNYDTEMQPPAKSWDTTSESYTGTGGNNYERNYSVANTMYTGDGTTGGNYNNTTTDYNGGNGNNGAGYNVGYYYDAYGNPQYDGAQPVNNEGNWENGGEGGNWDPNGYNNNWGNNNGGGGGYGTDEVATTAPSASVQPIIDGAPPARSTYDDLSCTKWYKNVFNALGYSVPWKLYICFHFYAVFVLVTLLGFNAMYACIYRMYSLPSYDKLPFWQTMAFFTILLALHFFIGSVLTLIYEYTRDFWNLNRNSTYVWGISSKTVSHWVIHMFMFTVYIPLPFLWSIIYTSMQHRNVLYFFEFYFFLTMMIMFIHIVIGFVWMYWRALVRKRRAYRDRVKTILRPLEEGGVPVPSKMKWYENPLVLKEYGMDIASLSAMMAYTFCGFIFHLIMTIVMSIDGLPEQKNSPGWLGVGLGYFILIYIIREMANSKRWYRVGLACVASIFLYVILALAGCGITGNGVIGVWIVLFVATQGLCLRKRDYFSREEPAGEMYDANADEKARVDPYLCCCQVWWRTCFGSLFESWFGREMTPAERTKTNDLRSERRSLWSDVKLMNNYLILFGACLILLLVFGRLVRIKESNNIAVRREGAIVSATAPHVLCSWSPKIANFDFTIMDVAYLTSLSYSTGDILDKDFKLWFNHKTNMTRNWPRIVATDSDIGGTVNVHFLDFYDATTQTHFIVLRSFAYSTSWMRDVDTWGEAIVYQIASIAVPFVSSWPDHLKVDFVDSMSFLKNWFGGNNVTDEVELYVKKVKEQGHNVVLSGHGSNGGYAKIVAARLQTPVIAFNSPGTLYSAKKFGLSENFGNEVTVLSTRDWFGYIDMPAGATHYIPCDSDVSETRCTDMKRTASTLLQLCGDKYGREFK